ncbi:hypothetical protein OWR28_08055 [Chryseobacterium sp. 1B4]
MFTKYDTFGRVVYSGFFASTETRASIQAAVNAVSANVLNNENSSTTAFTQNGLDVYYTRTAFPTGSVTLLSVNYYDQYPAGSPAQPAQIQNQATLGASPVTITSNGWSSVRSIKTYSTASYTKNIENDNWTSSFIWYDTLGRMIGAFGKNPLGGFTKTESILDFSGKALETYTYHSRNTSSAEVSVKDRYVYNPQHYLSKHYQQINTNPEELLSEYTYNDLGQVANKKVGNNLQSMDYTYNIRGWLTGINPNDFSGVNNKLFAYKLKYNTVEGAENPNNSYPGLKVKPKYNGGIAEVDWKTAYGANEPLRRYGYVYDGADRLRAGFFQMATNPYSKEYSEVMDYDLNGNISTLNRTGALVGGTAEVMDDLTYTYDGNRLSYMKESGKGNALSGYPLGTGQGQTIGYDGNGNMTSHLDKGFTAISYNFLNLPSKITHTNTANSLQYVYAANGSKVQMIQGTETTYYLGNFQYTLAGTAVSSQILANEEGYYDFVNSRYVYQYKDHLGNIRISYTRNTGGGTTILEENNYYAFGLKHGGYNTGDTTNNKFKYLYNGKELQSNGNLDYGWRQYMPDLGRWNGMDVLSESYQSTSPYAYVMNNPVLKIDPNGMLSQAFMDEISSSASGTTWTNNNNGTFTNNWGGMMNSKGRALNYRLSAINSLNNDGGGSGPKPGFWTRVSNWWDSLFGRNKGADILTLTRGAEVSRVVEVGEPIRIAEFFSAVEATSVAVGAATLGAVLTPVMMKDPEYNWTRDLPLTVPTTVATDVPADESGNLYLYRNMRNVNGMPMVGEGLDKLGLRDRDVNLLSNSTMITPLFANGLSVTVGYGDVIPPNVPDFSRGKGTIFRISASSLMSYGLVGVPVLNPDVPNYGQIRPAIPMNVGTFRALIQSTAPAWQPVK